MPARDRVRRVGPARLLELTSDDVTPDDVRDGADRTEPLDPEEARESAHRSELARRLLCQPRGLLRIGGQVPDDNPEAITGQVANLEGRPREVDIKDLHVPQVQTLNRLRGGPLRRHQLGRHRTLVLRPGEADPPSADVQW